MSVALSFFYVLICLCFVDINRNFFLGASPPIPYQGFALNPLKCLQCPPDPQLNTRVLSALPSVNLNNQSIKKTIFGPLFICVRCKFWPVELIRTLESMEICRK